MSKRYRGEELPKISTQKSALCVSVERQSETERDIVERDRKTDGQKQ